MKNQNEHVCRLLGEHQPSLRRAGPGGQRQAWRRVPNAGSVSVDCPGGKQVRPGATVERGQWPGSWKAAASEPGRQQAEGSREPLPHIRGRQGPAQPDSGYKVSAKSGHSLHAVLHFPLCPSSHGSRSAHLCLPRDFLVEFNKWMIKEKWKS